MAPIPQHSQTTPSVGAHPAGRNLLCLDAGPIYRLGVVLGTHAVANLYIRKGVFPYTRLTVGDVRLEPSGGHMRW